MNNAKVYVVMRGLTDNDYGNRETWIDSVHTTWESAEISCQAKRLEQLADEVKAVRAQPSYVPELRYLWYVEEFVLNAVPQS